MATKGKQKPLAAAGHYKEAPEDLTKRPPKLKVFGLVVEERPKVEDLEAWLLEPGRLPTGPVWIDSGVQVLDCEFFVRVSLAALKAGIQAKSPQALTGPFYYRLLALKFILDQ